MKIYVKAFYRALFNLIDLLDPKLDTILAEAQTWESFLVVYAREKEESYDSAERYIMLHHSHHLAAIRSIIPESKLLELI